MDRVRESISKMKNWKTSVPSDSVSEMTNAVWEAGVHMISDVVNQIKVGVIISAEWKFSTIVNC